MSQESKGYPNWPHNRNSRALQVKLATKRKEITLKIEINNRKQEFISE